MKKFLTYLKNDSIWQESYSTQTYKDNIYGIYPCLTINSPIDKLMEPNNYVVCIFKLS